MMKLKEPQYSFDYSLNECLKGIVGNKGLENKLKCALNKILELEEEYNKAACAGTLCKIDAIRTDDELSLLLVKNIKRSDLIKVYDQYFVPEGKPARRVYNSLMNAAKEECPFCGGIGTPRNLDHFLPKGHFPQFSVLPRNLVPSCRDCNMDGKADYFAQTPEAQVIQPYQDKDIFFTDQWVFATYIWSNDREPGRFLYSVQAPHAWSEVDKKRVRKHFEDFDLARRYSTRAAQLLGTVLSQIEQMKSRGIESDIICEILLDPAEKAAPFPNHWQKGFYQALRLAFL